MPRVTVLGSLNMDISVSVPRLAGPGETVLGADARLQPGGKGANQALAAARLGASVRMVGCCGADDFGVACRAALRDGAVNVTAVRVIQQASTGLALISVDPAGENSIIVAPGANGLAGPAEAAAALAGPADALVLSAEIPVAVLTEALRRARAAGVRTVLNLAPVPPEAGPLLAAGVDWLVVNAPEAGVLLGQPVTGPDGARSAAEALAGKGPRHVVITLGPAGAVLGGVAGPHAVPGFSVAQRGQRGGRGRVRRRAGRGRRGGCAAGRSGPAGLRGGRHRGHPARCPGRPAGPGRRAGGHRRPLARNISSAEARGADSAGLGAKRWCAVASRRVARRGSSRTVFREGR